MNKLNKKSKKKFISIGICLIILSLVIIVFVFKDQKNYSKNLINENYDYVYTYTEKNTGTFTKQIPHVNLEVENVNNKIDNFTLQYLNTDDNIISYQYSITNNILSLVIRIISFKGENPPINYFQTYNINLDTLEEITDEELLKAFKVTTDNVLEKIEKKFKDFYYDLVFAKKVDETKCNVECFIDRRGFYGYMQDINYYVNNGKLIVYKPFIINSSTWEYDYFKTYDFAFEIA